MDTSLLLVDPHVILREGIRELLAVRQDLFITGEASDGLQALELVDRLEPQIAIVEIALPRLSGLEVTRRLSRKPSGPRVIVLSQFDTQRHVDEALRAGAAGYMVKSGSAKELLHAIDVVRRGQTYLSAAVAQHVVESAFQDREAPRTGLSRLTSREREVLQLIAEGLSGKEIASTLGVSAKTVETHRARIMEKLGIHKVSGLVRYAIREGLLAP